MKISETVERDCCQQRDFKPVEGTKIIGRIPSLVFCQHCGHYWEYTSCRDAAGSADYEYRKLKIVPAHLQ